MKLNCPRCGVIHPQCPPLNCNNTTPINLPTNPPPTITHVENAHIQVPMPLKPELKWAPDYAITNPNTTRHVCDARNGKPK